MHTDRCGNTLREKYRAKGTEKDKIKSLYIEIKQMWILKCKNIPVIICATGIVAKVLRKNLVAKAGNLKQIHYKDSYVHLEH